jgi:hypothetical protein
MMAGVAAVASCVAAAEAHVSLWLAQSSSVKPDPAKPIQLLNWCPQDAAAAEGRSSKNSPSTLNLKSDSDFPTCGTAPPRADSTNSKKDSRMVMISFVEESDPEELDVSVEMPEVAVGVEVEVEIVEDDVDFDDEEEVEVVVEEDDDDDDEIEADVDFEDEDEDEVEVDDEVVLDLVSSEMAFAPPFPPFPPFPFLLDEVVVEELEDVVEVEEV